MKIIAHRGYWKKSAEKNTGVAFKRAFTLGFGIETDVRDYKGKLVISHDIADSKSMLLKEFLQIYRKYRSASCYLALNIKSDGLADLLGGILKKYCVRKYFVFDMSMPDMLAYLGSKMRYFSRQSEYEKEPALLQKAAGIVLDEFRDHWVTDRVLLRYLALGKQICIISPELHQRSYLREWRHYLKFITAHDSKSILLCTDYPQEARRFFYGR